MKLDCIFVFLVWTALFNLYAAEKTKVSYISPKLGGLNGQTRVSIFGEGFNTSLRLGSREPTTEVKFVSPFNEYACLVHDAESHERQIVCYTVPMAEGNYQVRVIVNGIPLDLRDYCSGNANNGLCRMHIRYWRTPLIYSLQWYSKEPQSFLSIRGRLFTNVTTSSVAAASNGLELAITRVYLTSGICQLYNESNQLPFGVTLEGDEGQSLWGSFTCLIESSYVGSQNLSFIVNSDYGRSLPYLRTKRISADNKLYMLQTYAVITDVQPKVGSTEGKTLLTISGRHFDDYSGIRAKVLVGGVKCDVQSVTKTEITCLTSSQAPFRGAYSGGRGARVEFFPGSIDISSYLNTSDEGYRTQFVEHAQYDLIGKDDRLSIRSRGFFVPSVSANYVFSIRGDDTSRFYFNAMGNDPSEAKLEAYCSRPHFTNYSRSIPLTAGKEYYYEMRVVEYYGVEFFTIGVHGDKTVYTPKDTDSVVSEIQNIEISSYAQKEVQTFKIVNWREQSPKNSVWSVSIRCLNEALGCQGSSFILKLFGTTTGRIMYGSSANEVSRIINSLILLGKDSVTVTKLTLENNYQISFVSNRGRIVPSAKDVDSRLKVTLTEDVIGEPKLDTITLQVDGLVTTAISFNPSEEEVETAIMNLFGSSCPDEVKLGIGRNFQYYDMESDSIPSGSRSSEISFCGSYSLKNPDYIYRNSDRPYKALTYQHICFAYIGDISDVFQVTYSYSQLVDGELQQSSLEPRNIGNVGLINSVDEWKHYCYNIYDRLKLNHPDGRDITITAVRIWPGSDSDVNLYLDNIFFGLTQLSTDKLNEAIARIIPPAVSHIRLNSVSVVKNESEYEVTFDPIDCGYNFPLLEFAFGNKREISENEQEFRFGSGDSKIVVKRLFKASPPVTGTFGIDFDDDAFNGLSGLKPDMSELALKNELESLMQIENVDVTRTGTCYGYKWKVEFEYPGGSYPQMIPSDVDLASSPSPPSITVQREQLGGIVLTQIPGDFLRIAHDTPQVQVFINNVPSHCSAEFEPGGSSCSYQWLNTSTPIVDSVNPITGSPGDSIVIAGKLFSENTGENKVTIGGVDCIVTNAVATGLTCTIGDSATGNQPLVVLVNGKGLAKIENAFKVFKVNGVVNDITPKVGSTSGCVNVSISGKGFDDTSTVTIKGSPCIVFEVSYRTIKCESTPSIVGTGIVRVTTGEVTVDSSVQFEYTNSGVPVIDNISPSSFSVKGGESVQITGSGFGSNIGSVWFGTKQVPNITSWSNLEITLLNPVLSPKVYNVRVVHSDIGCASTSPTVSYIFTVTAIQPTRGSLAGGTEVTLTGTGFKEDMTVKFGDVVCGNNRDLNEEKTSLKCTTEAAASTHVITNGGRHPTFGVGYGWQPSTLDVIAGDKVTFAWNVPSQVTDVFIGVFTTSDTLSTTYNGEGFNVSPASSGNRTFTLNNVGLIHYGSGCINDKCDLFMRGTINVRSASSITDVLSVTIDDKQAQYPLGDFSFQFDPNRTPVVTSIYPRQGTTNDVITIEGERFYGGAVVTVGGKSCDVNSRSTTSITCNIKEEEELSIETYHEVSVSINGRGYSRNEIQTFINRTFVLLPLVKSISPTHGSKAGGTKVTIEGSGFSDQFTVTLADWVDCDVIAEETTYNTITCVSATISYDASGPVTVTSPGLVKAECASPPCEYAFTEESTPTVTSWFRNEQWEDLNITFVGRGFGEDITGVVVALESNDLHQECTVTSVSDTEIVCNIKRFAVGENDIKVRITEKGLARFDEAPETITSPNTIDGVSPSSGSINGGTKLTISGNGFVDGNTEVTVGGISCFIESINLSSITCVTGALSQQDVKVKVISSGITYPRSNYQYSNDATPQVDEISPEKGTGGSEVVLSGSGFETDTDELLVTIGGVKCEVTSSNSTTVTCTLGSRQGGHALIEVLVPGKGFASVSANFTYSLSVTGVAPMEGSYGGGQLITIDGEGFSSTTTVTICENNCEIKSQTSSQLTCLAPSNHNREEETTSCSIKVSNLGTNVTSGSSYNYLSAITAVINEVTPSRGGTAGGTRITIRGSGFPNTATGLSVSIDRSECTIINVEDSSIVCDTNEHKGSIEAKVAVKIGTNGIAYQENADFYYIDRWSSIYTWGGTSLPVDQDFVIIQKGQTVLLDTDTAVMKMLLIDGGELIFDEQDVALRAENILITNGGRLQVGTEEEPFQSNAQIIMYGHLRSPELPIYGAKTLALRDGTLDLHGRHTTHPWTKLATTADAGSSEITVEASVDWRVGDRIVIATTGLRHSQGENEERNITAVSAGSEGTTLTLGEPLEYQHLGITENLGGRSVEFRAEVGLLSRNILFRGSEDHVWNDEIPACEEGFDTGMFATQTCFQGRFGEEVGSDQFGASIMVHTKDPNSKDTVARIENVEITYAGQAFRLGRYPVHWHLMGDATGHYIRRCAIHKTFNRAVTIHGTHNLTVDSNVVYNIMGGAIFIEDGIETGNVIQYNLAIFVRQSTSLLNDDVTPAAYWVTNPNNILMHNHAAGGTHFGFWYRMHEHPDGPSFTPDICQQHVELGKFENNTVHSQGWFGLWIFESYFPMEGGRCDSTVPSPAKFRSLTTWNCEKGAEWVDCGAIQFIDFVMVNNEVAGIEAKLLKDTFWGDEKGALVDNSLIVGHSDISPSDYETEIGIILPFGPGLLVRNTNFLNFDRGGVAFGATTVQGVCVKLCGGYYYWTEGLSFSSVTKKVLWRWLHEGVIVDRDGSLTNEEPMTKVLPHSGIMDPSSCPISSGDQFSSGLPSAVCDPDIRFHRVALKNPIPSSLEGNLMYFSNDFGNTSSTYEKKRLTHAPGWMLLLQSQKEYTMWFDDGQQFSNITFESKFYDFLNDDYLFVNLKLQQTPDVIEINNEARYSIENATSLRPTSNNLDWFFSQESKTLQFIVSGKSTSPQKRAIEINDEAYKHVEVSPSIYRCLYANCIGPANPDQIPPSREKPDDFVLWSEENNPCLEWIGNHTVFIKRSADANESRPAIPLCWVVVDVPTIEVVNITVEGVLHFENTDVDVSAIYIMVQGGRIVAGFSKAEHFTNKLTITLRGNHATEAWALPGVELGSKALGCFGGCDFHGKFHNTYWTHLDKTANAGSKRIVLVDEVDWSVGDKIVITTTGYRSQETEKHVVEEVGEDFKTLTLREELKYRHLGEEYAIGEWQFPMRAEVGLLSRNIKIIGETSEEIERQAFGARVLVGTTQTAAGNDIRGWARFTDVEFWRTGQLGWTDPWDPRFSIAWVDTGAPSPARPSELNGCAFHDGYATAIGVFGTEELTISDNVVHRAIHDGIRITGSNNRLERNLVAMTLFRDSYGDRFEPTNFKDWPASFEVSQANQITLIGNTAAGSERLGFHVDGEVCGAPEEGGWKKNSAHGCLHGIHIFKEDGIAPCSMIRNFIIYKSWDYGIYHQTKVSIEIKNTMIADSTVGYFPMIYEPLSTQHKYDEKSASMENIVCIGRSEHFDPSLDFMDEVNDKNLLVRSHRPSRKAPLNPTGGKTCVMLPLFQSGPNGAPFKPFHNNQDYPALHGSLKIKNFHAHSFKKHDDNTRDLVFCTNPANEDAYHPTSLSHVILSDVEDASKIFYPRPSLGKINPSDCVDMECDGMKKVLVRDEDGGFLGEPGAVVPQAEFGWDDESQTSRGLGDYRIPKTMLTATDGSRFPVENIATHRGIIRSEGCTYNRDWQAYDCQGSSALNYRMLVIESLDEDSETRRLSPVALLGNGYLDLNNGPQDHGWCFGYTCQLRLSTFYTIVATGNHFSIFFTGTTPRGLRLHLLNADNSESIRVAIWYSKPERLDVRRNHSGLYVQPENAFYNLEENLWDLKPVTPENKESFKPAIDSDINGANFFDISTQLLYVTVKGSEPVTINTAPAILIAFSVPAVTADEFFEKNLIENLAKFLKVPSYKIRIVSVVRETNLRRKRDTNNSTTDDGIQMITAQISDEVRNEESPHQNTTTEEQLTAEALNNAGSVLLEAFQSGSMSEVINTTVIGFASTQAVENATIENIEEPEVLSLVQHKIPSAINVSMSSIVVEEFLEFSPVPFLTLVDQEGEVVPAVGGNWTVVLALSKVTESGDLVVELLEETTRPFIKGKVELSKIKILDQGVYKLACKVLKPSGDTFGTVDVFVRVILRNVSLVLIKSPEEQLHKPDEEFSYVLELQNSKEESLEALGYKGHVWYGDITVLPTDNSADGAFHFEKITFEFDTARMQTPLFKLANTRANVSYMVLIQAYTEPTLYNLRVISALEFVASETNSTNNETESTKPPVVVVGPPNLECPEYQATDMCEQKSQWLCEYVRWRIEVSHIWRHAFNKWRIMANRSDSLMDEEHFKHDCRELEVTCKNDDQWGEMEDYYNCPLPYCRDGHYKGEINFNAWKEDQTRWKKIFNGWKEMLSRLNREDQSCENEFY